MSAALTKIVSNGKLKSETIFKMFTEMFACQFYSITREPAFHALE